MRANKLKELFAKNQVALGAWMGFSSSFAAEVMGHSDMDAVVVDLQHGPLYLDAALPMLQAISATPAMPMVRVALNQFFEINKVLDAGAYGVICPLVNNAKDAESFVSACRYPPQGTRSFGPSRGVLYGGPDYFAHANESILKLAMIETLAGMKNLDSILKVDGIDGVFIGPGDLSLALGLPPSPNYKDGPLKAALAKIYKAARKHKKMVGIFCTSLEFSEDMKRLGYDFIVLANDAYLLRNITTQWAKAIRQA
jgi:4-hydroxy-2-oxoheptanedioate aldolase